MKSRLLVSAVGIPVLLYVVLWSPTWCMAAGLLLLTWIGAYELMQCVGERKHRILSLATGIAAMLMMWQFSGETADRAILFLFAYLVICFTWAILSGGTIPSHLVMAGLFSVTLIPYAFSSFLRLFAQGLYRGFLLLPFVFSFMSDTGGYFVGRTFGKHKLAPHISPKKTVEGAIGGLLGNAVGGVVFAFVMGTWCGESMDYLGVVVVGIMCSVLAQLGDLSFSLIKREYGIKDYGKLFLEHGGVLDRFDSVIYVAPVLAALLPILN